jgi:hypothetical protein
MTLSLHELFLSAASYGNAVPDSEQLAPMDWLNIHSTAPFFITVSKLNRTCH